MSVLHVHQVMSCLQPDCSPYHHIPLLPVSSVPVLCGDDTLPSLTVVSPPG